eukprot:TRINITY_DN2699_c0_g1_i1.p1 TRINITY_DN2699_c0_g1~~TRINITY_DN2699_c0_g1_i1.p1  ORF type:complete len:518 (-),score=124.16 TRINITY_DN2699_c0_g1_i1:465-2018(-)
MVFFFFFQAEDGIRDAQESRGLGDVYKRQGINAEYGDLFRRAMLTRILLLLGLTAIAARRTMDTQQLPSQLALSAKQLPAARYVTQAQDHFDLSNKRTWQQAYYVNDTFFTPGSDAPVFLCVGGEGPPIDGSAVVSSVHCNVAVEWLPETKALMVAVEHRYYGCHNMSACPFSTSDKEPLKFLSSHQAVEDLASAHAHVTAEYNLTSKNKWISWGGSYPGMLASFFKIKHPELVHASVASSAPVIAKLDMPEYNDITAQAYGLVSVGGSPACTLAIAKGHADIGRMFGTAKGREALSAQFGVSAAGLETREGQASFAGNGVAYFPSQGNDPSCTAPACNIEQICKAMTDTKIGDEVARLAEVRKAQLALQIAPSQAEPNELDYWGYQTCTEFGFYQTCELGSNCFYTQGLVLLEDMMAFCTSDFGIANESVAEAIAATNKFYGADHPNATRVFYPNGDVDPWHGLSKLTASPGLPVLMVSGASHHAWTHPSAPTDQESVIAARATIRAQVSTWLNQE